MVIHCDEQKPVIMKVPEVDTAVRSLTVMWDGSLVVAANNHGTCYVWRLLRGTQVSHLLLYLSPC